MLTWNPVDRAPSPPLESEETPAPLPPAEASNVSKLESRPAVAPSPPAAPPFPSPEPEGEEEEEPAEPEEMPSSIALEHIDPSQEDPATIQPPSASGPYKELQTIFESAARDASSAGTEAAIESAFKVPEVPEGLLEAAVCQGQVCRIRTRWTPGRAGGFMHAMVALGSMRSDTDESPLFERNYGFGKASERNTSGEQYVEVYVHKKITDPDVPKKRH